MKLKCLIIDDEPIARKLLQEYIEETDFLELAGTAENPLKATGLINELKPDLIYLDINMPKMTGLEFLRSVAQLPMVIMTTAYGQYALDGFEMAVIDYLVKPFSLERFLKASNKALELHTLKQNSASVAGIAADHFFVKCDGRIEKIVFDELMYVEAMSNYVTLYTLNGKRIAYLTIKGILENLPPGKFMQVHKSYIVNPTFVNSIEGNMLHLAKTVIPVGQSYHEQVMDTLLSGRYIKR
jgi:DNA-binding LytR/AlgR family response regulator